DAPRRIFSPSATRPRTSGLSTPPDALSPFPPPVTCGLPSRQASPSISPTTSAPPRHGTTISAAVLTGTARSGGWRRAVQRRGGSTGDPVILSDGATAGVDATPEQATAERNGTPLVLRRGTTIVGRFRRYSGDYEIPARQ